MRVSIFFMNLRYTGSHGFYSRIEVINEVTVLTHRSRFRPLQTTNDHIRSSTKHMRHINIQVLVSHGLPVRFSTLSSVPVQLMRRIVSLKMSRHTTRHDRVSVRFTKNLYQFVIQGHFNKLRLL